MIYNLYALSIMHSMAWHRNSMALHRGSDKAFMDLTVQDVCIAMVLVGHLRLQENMSRKDSNSSFVLVDRVYRSTTLLIKQ